MKSNPDQKSLGFGLGLRSPHLETILKEGTRYTQWFEILSENYLGQAHGGFSPSLNKILKIREKYPLVMHGVSMNLGGSDQLNFTYLQKLKDLAEVLEPAWISDHLCWTSLDGQNSHDLLPLPLHQETLKHVGERIESVQEFLKRPFVVENVSSYVVFPESTMSEAEFLTELSRKTGCYLLCDLNNFFVSGHNHNFSVLDEIKKMPWDRVLQIHLAGPKAKGDLYIDTHDHPVRDEVWKLLEWVYQNGHSPSTMIEWDDKIPDFSELELELKKAIDIYEMVASHKSAERSL